MSAPERGSDHRAHAGAAPHLQALLAAVDKAVGDAHVRERFGDVGQAFSAALGSWIEPLAQAAMAADSTAHSRAAARAMADLARLAGAFAGEAVRPIVRAQAETADTVPGRHYAAMAGRIDDAFRELSSSPELDRTRRYAAMAGRIDDSFRELSSSPEFDRTRRYAAMAGRIDDAFREFSSSPEFDRARRDAAAAVLDWLERDPAATSGLACALEPPPPFVPDSSDILSPFAPEPSGVPPPETEPSLRDGNAALTSFPGTGETRASVLVIPGFTAGTRMLDLDPQHSVVRTLAAHAVDAWLLDWGRTDETDRHHTVASQLERIDRAVDAVREAANGRRPALAGHFHGGLLALLYCLRHPGKAGALITVSTPVRFASSDDGFAGWLRACDGERMVDVLGNIPGPLVAALVAASSPMRWCGGGFLELLNDLDSADAARRIARFEQARRFPPAFPGETFRGLYRAFYRDDSFATRRDAVIDGHRYALSGLRTPLLNVFARDDRIVPPSASAPLAEWTGADAGSNLEHPGGHYELVTGHRAHAELLPGIAGWLVELARAS